MVTLINFYASGLTYGWEEEDVEKIDIGETENKLIQILREIAPFASFNIFWEEGNDQFFGKWEDQNEEQNLKTEIADFPWYDADRWCVFK
jgi:hypothetical protein